MPEQQSPPPPIVLQILLVALLSLGQFLDTFNSSAFFAAIPSIAKDIHLQKNSTVWLVSAYQITFSSFLLLSGRITDVYNPKFIMITGSTLFGILSLVTGFVRNPVIFLVLRALIGIAATLTIPSALNLISSNFEDRSRAFALAAFGGSAALGNVFGLILGALFTQFTHWPWIFFFEAAVALPIALLSVAVIPSQQHGRTLKTRDLDWAGVILLTALLLLFILAITSGSTYGWKSLIVILPLTFSAILAVLFGIWELHRSAAGREAAIPSSVWKYRNFRILMLIALAPFLWLTIVFLTFTTLWQNVYQWTPLAAAIHLLPIGIFAVVTMAISGRLATTKIHAKWVILCGQLLVVGGTALLPFADRPARYWTYAFPGFGIATIGTAVVYTRSNIATLQSMPTELAGTAGALFSTSLQFGATIGVAAITAVQSNVGEHSSNIYQGSSAGFWCLFGFSAALACATAIFYRIDLPTGNTEGTMSSETESSEGKCDVLSVSNL
ncbi:MFS general substrate transporter [Mycena venus]|uniref:MFS general substrate transporter n=1 Tax=Mycena venus TaxID=2733690 RepID=A0A8H7D3H9_9AGAR|nr:MFS general substrate transporter [Mycena venus]